MCDLPRMHVSQHITFGFSFPSNERKGEAVEALVGADTRENIGEITTAYEPGIQAPPSPIQHHRRVVHVTHSPVLWRRVGDEDNVFLNVRPIGDAFRASGTSASKLPLVHAAPQVPHLQHVYSAIVFKVCLVQPRMTTMDGVSALHRCACFSYLKQFTGCFHVIGP